MIEPKLNKGGKKAEFIGKLTQILEDKSNADVIKFDMRYRQIVVQDKAKLQEILPMYFKHSNMDSFTRQLNWFGFYKVRGYSSHIFRHPELKKGKNICDLKSNRKILAPVKKKIRQLNNQPMINVQNQDVQNRNAQKMSQNSCFCWQYQPYLIVWDPNYTDQITYYLPQYFEYGPENV